MSGLPSTQSQLRPHLLIALFLLLAIPAVARHVDKGYEPGRRVVMDAHNCYPYFEWWGDRIDRALNTGTPLAIEQDLYWYKDPKSGKSREAVEKRWVAAIAAGVDFIATDQYQDLADLIKKKN